MIAEILARVPTKKVEVKPYVGSPKKEVITMTSNFHLYYAFFVMIKRKKYIRMKFYTHLMTMFVLYVIFAAYRGYALHLGKYKALVVQNGKTKKLWLVSTVFKTPVGLLMLSPRNFKEHLKPIIEKRIYPNENILSRKRR